MIWIDIKYLPHYGDLPKLIRSTEGASGYDLHAANEDDLELPPQRIQMVPTGIALSIPTFYEGQIRSRSGLATEGIFTLNSPGTIDSDYRGEIKVVLANFSGETFFVKRGMRIAQIVFAPVMEIAFREKPKLDETKRGKRGFGSTGIH